MEDEITITELLLLLLLCNLPALIVGSIITYFVFLHKKKKTIGFAVLFLFIQFIIALFLSNQLWNVIISVH